MEPRDLTEQPGTTLWPLALLLTAACHEKNTEGTGSCAEQVLEQTYKHDHATILKLNCLKKKKNWICSGKSLQLKTQGTLKVCTKFSLLLLKKKQNNTCVLRLPIFFKWVKPVHQCPDFSTLTQHVTETLPNDGQHFLDRLGNLICVEAVNLIHTAFLLAGCSSGRKEWEGAFRHDYRPKYKVGFKKKNPSSAQIARCFIIHSFHIQYPTLSWLIIFLLRRHHLLSSCQGIKLMHLPHLDRSHYPVAWLHCLCWAG